MRVETLSRRLTRAAFIVAIAALAGCQEPRRDPACHVPGVGASNVPVHASTRLSECLARFAAELATGPDGADTIARAVVLECSHAVELAKDVEYRERGGPLPPAQINRELDAEVDRQVTEMATDRARLEVLRRRAAHCPHREWGT